MYVGSFPFASEDPGLSFVFGIANSDVNPSTLEKEINGEFSRIKNELISEIEFQKIRNMMENDFIAASVNIEELDPAAEGLPIVRERLNKKIKTVMSNSFGFGGTNASLVFSTEDL